MAEYLITGGCGFVGSHLADALLARGDGVVVLDNLSTGKRSNLAPEVRVIEGDVADPEVVAQAIAGCAGVFHLAGIASVAYCNEHWRKGHLTNQTGTVTVFEAAARAGRVPVVYTSSAAVYGDAGSGAVDEARVPRPQTPYGVDKLGSELHGRIAMGVHGLPTVGLRPFNIYGPRQDPSSAYSGVISIFNSRLAQGLPVTVFGDGLQTRDFVFVADVVRANILAAEQGSGLYNVACGSRITVNDLARAIIARSGSSSCIEYAPPRGGDVRHSRGNAERLRGLGWSPSVPLEVGLALTFGG